MKSRRSENQRTQVRNKNAKAVESVSLNTVLYRRVILELCLEKLNDHTHAWEIFLSRVAGKIRSKRKYTQTHFSVTMSPFINKQANKQPPNKTKQIQNPTTKKAVKKGLEL